MKKTLSFILLAVCVLCIAQSCSTKSAPQNKIADQLRLNIESEPDSLDPRKARELNALNTIRLLFDGLMRMNPQEKLELALAEKIDISEDGKTYIFHLRASKWTNGLRLKASDFVYAWKKVLSPSFIAPNAFQMYVIKNAAAAKEERCSLDEVGIAALDETTLCVQLQQPTPYFLELLTLPVYFPICQSVDEKNPQWAQEASSYVSNGPFSMEKWQHQDELLLKKNLLYWDVKTVKLPQIHMVMVRGDTAFQMFEKEELDWMGSPISSLPISALASLKSTHGLEVKPFLATAFLRLNTTRAPFQHPLIRKAFALAVNRRVIVEHVLQGGQMPATGLVPSKMGLQTTPHFTDADIAEASRLLTEGMKIENLEIENFPELTLTYLNNERNHLVAQTIQQQWREAFGFQIKLEGIESKVFFDRISKQDFQMSLGSWTADFNDPINFLEVFKYKKNGPNNTAWENSDYIQDLDLSLQALDFTTRRDLLVHAETILMEEMPIIPIYHFSMPYVKNRNLQNEALSAWGSLDFKWASLQGANYTNHRK